MNEIEIKIEQRQRVREAMVESMRNLSYFENLDFSYIAMHIQNHLTDRGFETVKTKHCGGVK